VHYGSRRHPETQPTPAATFASGPSLFLLGPLSSISGASAGDKKRRPTFFRAVFLSTCLEFSPINLSVKPDDFRTGSCFNSYDNFGDCHDEIAIAGVDFIGRRPICYLYLQEEGCFWEPPTRIATPGHRSHRRWLRRGFQGLKVMIMQPLSYPTMQLPIFFQQFRCFLD